MPSIKRQIRQSRAVTARNCTKKCDARVKLKLLFFSVIWPTAFFLTFSLPLRLSSDLKFLIKLRISRRCYLICGPGFFVTLILPRNILIIMLACFFNQRDTLSLRFIFQEILISIFLNIAELPITEEYLKVLYSNKLLELSSLIDYMWKNSK